MPDLKHIYNHQADEYEQLVSCEDYEGNLLRAIQEIMPLKGIDILESGAGTGRVTFLLAPFARSIRAFDLAAPMLTVAQSRLQALNYQNVEFAVGGHLDLPATEASVDLIISGWSMCYVYVDGGDTWRDALSRVVADFQRFLRPNGKIILIETLGTGNKEPLRIPSLADYLNQLDDLGFHLKSIRTDYRFDDAEQARRLSAFFFGEEIWNKLEDCILPECTGLWWKGKAE